MSRPGLERCLGPILALGILAGSNGHSAGLDQQADAAAVAGDFIRALTDGDIPDLLGLMTDPFTFDGVVVEGEAPIRDYLGRQLAGTVTELMRHPDPRIEVFAYPAAVSRFGKPPAKFSHIRLKKCLFATVRYARRPGFLMILHKKKKEGWRVTAVTD